MIVIVYEAEYAITYESKCYSVLNQNSDSVLDCLYAIVSDQILHI